MGGISGMILPCPRVPIHRVADRSCSIRHAETPRDGWMGICFFVNSPLKRDIPATGSTTLACWGRRGFPIPVQATGRLSCGTQYSFDILPFTSSQCLCDTLEVGSHG